MGDCRPQSHGSTTAGKRQGRTVALLAQQERLEREVADILAKKHSLEMQLINIRRHLNDELAVHQVPNEILVDIFRLVRGAFQTSADERNWIMLHSVCRRWRDVLCSTPAFWCNISMRSSPDWIKLCLSRSQNSLLSVHFPRSYPAIANSVIQSHLLPKSAQRVRSLPFIGLDPNAVESALVHLLTDSIGMPALAELALHRRSAMVIPARLPGSVEHLVSQLQSLDLHSYEVPRAFLLCRHLRSLRLTNTPFPHTTTLEQLLTTLSLNPLLEELVIQAKWNYRTNSHPHAAFESAPVQRHHGSNHTISFTKLHKVHLDSSRPLIQHILSTFRFPQATEVEAISKCHIGVLTTGQGILSQCLLLEQRSFAEMLPVFSSATALDVILDGSMWDCRVAASIPDISKPVVLAAELSKTDRLFSVLPSSLRDIIRTFSASPMAEISLKIERSR
ncbi:hypothetical protein L226DRAFT_158325 [Lentinus tigrinus ALCF2SS1-7]|uniref:uncharacterized protein n=1 Tax=Lentinus tigrinus ALCF2SS1-7 TaxID=1328758 RepID=UPI001165D962|nr:hypothetical protein L226DRAFT_158325 [Lentinus tigrinus ALCF2SS1-7]